MTLQQSQAHAESIHPTVPLNTAYENHQDPAEISLVKSNAGMTVAATIVRLVALLDEDRHDNS